MPGLILHARVAPADKIRVWLCVVGCSKLPIDLKWRLNALNFKPNIIKPLNLVHDYGTNVATGIFEFDTNNVPNIPVLIEVSTLGQDIRLKTGTMPVEVPSQDWFRILLSSCYHQSEDRQGLVSQTYLNIPTAERQDLSLLMGDQVYLDLPTLNNYPDDEAKLSRKFEKFYHANWTSYLGLNAILKNAPAVFCPDDHEYWNNFPHRSPIIQNSWKSDSQVRWKNAADQLYDAYQVASPSTRGDNIEIDIDPLSIIVLDQRCERKSDRTSALGSHGVQQLNDWVDRLIDNGKIGAVVTGQSLLDKPVSKFTGSVADWMLANYEDYSKVVEALARLSKAGRPVLLLTGDVHWGRVTLIKGSGHTKFIEIVCSPSSLVTTIGADQLKSLGAGFRKFFKSEKNRWPRHSDAPDAEPYFAPQVFGKRYQTTTLYKHKGDQFAMLAFRKAANTLEAKVTYYEVHKTPAKPKVVPLGLLR